MSLELTDAEILSIAYDLNAMPEQMTDAKLYRVARAFIKIAEEEQSRRIAELEQQVRWIPCSERLPEPFSDEYGGCRDSEPVALLLTNGDWCKAIYVSRKKNGGAWVSHYCPQVDGMAVAWLPLPPPPSENDNG